MSPRRAAGVAAIALLLAIPGRSGLADGTDSTRTEPETVAGGHSWLEATHITPPPQPPLAILSDDGVAPVRDAFRAGDGATRVVLLMSPT